MIAAPADRIAGGRSAAAAALLLAAVLGALQTPAFVHTRALWWLPLACTAGLAALVGQAAPRRAAALGWCFGSAWLGAAVWWLFISLHRYGHLPAPLAVAAVALLCGALSLYLALAMAWAARRRSGRPLADAAWFAIGWLAAELARALLFTGFPWAATGYSQVDGPLAALAPWVGVYGIGAALAFAAALPVIAWGHTGWRARGGAAALALALVALPAAVGRVEFSRPAGTLQVALLQTNVAQDEKFVLANLPATLDWVAAALGQAQADLVVAPDTAVPLLPDQLDELAPGYWAGLQQHFSRPGGPAALIGVPLGDERTGYTNSAVGLSAAATYRYDKTHLVPFGEFIPTGFRWFTELMSIPLGDFNRGPRRAPAFEVRGQRLAPNICYEDLFGEDLAQRFTDPDPASAPTMLVNLSNIAWFGDSIAIDQHLAISRLRSLELQRPMLRATNTGATAVIDHRGEVTASLPAFSRGVLQATVQGREGLTPFVRWVAVTGLWPLLIGAVLALAWPRRGARPR